MINLHHFDDIVIKNNEFEYTIVLKYCDESGGENFLSRLKLELVRELAAQNKRFIEFATKIDVVCIKTH